MNEEKLDDIIKSGLAKEIGSLRIEKTDSCPNETKLSEYLGGKLPRGEEQLLAEHIKQCYWCIEQLDLAQRARSILDIKERKMRLAGRKGMIRTNLINWIKKNKWLVGAAIAFILSFVFSRYFLQFLILTLLMGIKWIFTTGGTKTVIMIYDAWRRKSRKDRTTHFKNRL